MIQVTQGPKNLLAWNEDLDRNPPWTVTLCSIPSINNPSPQVGNNSAAILHESASIAAGHPITSYSTLNKDRVYCVSVFAKSINRSWLYMYNYQAVDGLFSPVIYANLTDGSIGFSINVLNAYCIPLPNSWWRCVSVFRSGYTALKSLTMMPATAAGVYLYIGLDQDSLYLWRPQINPGYYPDDTFRTAEVPVT